jgi:uncharacterized protein (TIGR02246 family)
MSRHDVETGEKEWLEAFNGGDASGVAAKYATDGRMLAPNADIQQGRPAIEAYVKEFLQMNAKLEFKLIDVHEAGDTCISVGQYELEFEPPGAGPQKDSGKFVEVWKRQSDGSWLIADDIYNSSLPLPTA